MAMGTSKVRLSFRTKESEGLLEVSNFPLACETTITESQGKAQFREICSGPIMTAGSFSFSIRIVWAVDKGVVKREKDIGVYLQREDASKETCTMQIEFEILNRDEAKNWKLKDTYYKLSPQEGRGWSPSFDRSTNVGLTLNKILDPSRGWLHEGSMLRIASRISVATGFDREASPVVSSNSLEQEVCGAMRSLLDIGCLADVTIKVRGERLLAHAAILAARSPVFMAMLSTPMREGREREVVLEDVDTDAVKALLRFLYSGDAGEEALASDDTAMALLQVAHRYEVTSLVELCTQALRARLTAENAAERFELAHVFGCGSLKASCLEFMWEHMSEVQDSDSYARLVERRPALLRDLVAAATGPTPKRRRTTCSAGSGG